MRGLYAGGGADGERGSSRCMKPRTEIIWLGAFLLGLTALSVINREANPDRRQNTGACCPLMAALDAKPVTVGPNHITTNRVAQQVIAYYFHGTVRCETCLMIEHQAKGVIEQQFRAELGSNRLVFMPLNYDLPENAHFLTDYKLPCPSLVLVKQPAGHEETWKLLGQTWQLVHAPVALNGYVETEVRTFLSGQQPHSTNRIERPYTPNQR